MIAAALGTPTTKTITPDDALSSLPRLLGGAGMAQSSMERAFVAALQGERVSSIGRFQVYSSYRAGETVVFIHDASGQDDHKYIFAKTPTHTYIVAAPMRWTEYHREILARVCAASGERAVCPGGGYVDVLRDGSLLVSRESGDFGRGDHVRATDAFQRAVKESGQ
jgi:hypothetical protein